MKRQNQMRVLSRVSSMLTVSPVLKLLCFMILSRRRFVPCGMVLIQVLDIWGRWIIHCRECYLGGIHVLLGRLGSSLVWKAARVFGQRTADALLGQNR